MKTIKLLDLCCKAGGCSVGYHQAADDLGFKIEITGIDIEPQPNFPYRFIQADAVEYLKNNFQNYTHIHASPPCQEYSNSTSVFRNKGKKYKDNLTEITEILNSIKTRSVIENVPQSPVIPDLKLFGYMFGLKVIRKRHFQLINWFHMQPFANQRKGSVKNGDYAQVFGNGQLKVTNGVKFKIPGNNVNEVWSNAMGINWMTNKELAEAIPPAYTRYIGNEFFKF